MTTYSIDDIRKVVHQLAVARMTLEKITQAYEADIYSLGDAIMVAEDALDTLDKIEKGVTI